MRLRTKLISAGAAVGMLASYSMVSLPQVGAADDGSVIVPLTCVGADEDTQALLDAGLDGVLKLSMKVTPDQTNPANANTGDVVDVAFDVDTILDQSLVDLAMDVLGVDMLTIKDFAVGVVAQGGGHSGPFTSTPSQFDVQLDPLSAPTVSVSGQVTIDDEGEPTVFSLGGQTTFTVVIITEGEGGTPSEAYLKLDCTADVGEGDVPFLFGGINGEAPPPPDTTTTTQAPTTTTTIDTSAQTDSSMLATVCTFTATANGKDITSVVQKQMGASTLAINLKVDATTPKQLGAGQTGDVSFAVSMPMDASTKTMAQNPAYKITAIELSNINFQIAANGGGHGGPYKALWNGTTGYAADLSTFTSPTGTASGTITIDDASVPTYFTVVNPLTYTVNITTGILGKIQMTNTCDVQVKGFGAINGSVPDSAAAPAPVAAKFAG